MAAVRVIFAVELLVYALFSVGDLILTCVLLRYTDGQVYESNPIARSWLESFGWKGLITFKILSSGLVAFVSLVIYWYRPRLGAAILALGCLVMGLVVFYSSQLLERVSRELESRSPFFEIGAQVWVARKSFQYTVGETIRSRPLVLTFAIKSSTDTKGVNSPCS
jgi:hypothetical protein